MLLFALCFGLVSRYVVADRYITNVEALGKVTINFFEGKDYKSKVSTDQIMRNPSNNLIELTHPSNTFNHAEFLQRKNKKLKRKNRNDTKSVSVIKREQTIRREKDLVIDIQSKKFSRKKSLLSIIDPIDPDDNPINTLRKLGLTSFAQLLEDAGFESVFGRIRNYTIFAPTNMAFRSMSSGNQLIWLTRRDPKKLVKYHVCRGKVENMVTGNLQSMVNSQSISITTSFNTLSIQSANVLTANVKSNNSVIHIIDKVLLYKPLSLIEIIESDPRLKLFDIVSRDTNIRMLLDTPFRYTIFSPTADAILKSEILSASLKAREKFVRAHVYGPGSLYMNNFKRGTVASLRMSTSRASYLRVRRLDGSTVRLNDNSQIEDGDILARNGVVHITDSVLN